MRQANHRNDWRSAPPSGPQLNVGMEFDIRTRERRVLWPGVRDYFQKDNRRYWCEVLNVKDEAYCVRRGQWRHWKKRCVARVRVLPVPEGEAVCVGESPSCPI